MEKNKYVDFCIRDAAEHFRKGEEALEASKTDPKKWYDDNMAVAKTFTDLFPMIYHSLTLQSHSLPLPTDSEES